ncbi:MAG: FAD-dependent oxidoreductase [Culicoidibacterales bacterium]
MKKVIVIGTNHAGTAAINTLCDNFKESVSVTTYDANTNISFLGCGMALWIGKVINKPDGLFYSNPETLAAKGANVKMRHRVEDVDFATKTVTVRNLETDEVFTDSADELIISTGSWPVRPALPGMDLENIISVKLFQDAEKTIEKLQNPDVKNIVVVGAGYIGVEIAEAFAQLGKTVTLVDMATEVVPRYFDAEFTPRLAQELEKEGVTLALGESVKEFKGENGVVTAVVTDKAEHKADMVMFSVGFKPQTKIFENKGLDMLPNGAIRVDLNQKTNIDGVYAIGDCATVYDNAKQKESYIALASNAVRSGIVAGFNVGGVGAQMNGVQGSNGIHIGGIYMVSTGMTLREAQNEGLDVDSFTATGTQHPEFMPQAQNEEVNVKVVFDKKTRRLVGAQIVSTIDVSTGLHFFSLAIQEGLTIDRLMLTDLFFMPHFNKPVDNIAAALIGAALK